MTLADQVLTEKKHRSNNPAFTHLSDDVIALCIVLEREGIRVKTCSTCYAQGAEPGVTARPRGRKGAKE